MPIWRNTTGDGLWGTAGNWIADGSGNSGVPTSGTDAIFDSLSPSCNVNTNARPCANFTTTGFTNTITFTFDVQVHGNVTLGAGMLFAGTGFINVRFLITNQTRILDVPTGLIVPRFSFGAGAGIAGIIQVSRSTTFNNFRNVEVQGVTTTINPASGSITLRVVGGSFGGQRTSLNSNITFEIDGNCTFVGGNFGGCTIRTLTGSTLTVTGTWACTGSIIDFSQATSVSFNSGIEFQAGSITINFPPSVGSIRILRGGFIILQSNVTVTELWYFPGNSGVSSTIDGAFKLIVLGNWDGGTNNGFAGTGTVSFEGNTNASWLNSINFQIANLVVDKGTGTLTFSNGTISSTNYTVTSGTIVHTGTLTLSGNQTITHTVPATYNNITIAGNLATKTLNSNSLNIAGTLTCNTNQTFSGTAGWTAANFIDTTAGTTITLQSGVNYTVTSNLRLLGTNASPILISSSSPTTRAFLTLNYGASMLSGDGLVSHAVYFVRATRIDSSLGQTIWNTFGSISTPLVDTVNWNPGSRPNPTSYTYII